MLHKTKLGALAVSAFLLALTANSASAQLINVKIGSAADGVTQSGSAVLGSSTSWWNNYAYVSSTPYQVSVVDDTGSSLGGVSLTVSNSGGVGSIGIAGSPSPLMSTARYQNKGGIWTVQFDGLQANSLYEFVGYTSYPNGPSGGSWSVVTGTAGSGTFSSDGSSADISTGVGKAYSQFFVTTDEAGTLVLNDTQTTTYVPFEGFQLSAVAAVPEPASWAMLLGGLGMIGLVARRRA